MERKSSIHVDDSQRMLAITPDSGKFFNILLQANSAKNILEIGTSVGYSTLWFADAVKEVGGKIITIDKDHSKITRAKKNFEEAKVSEMVEIKEGNAKDVLFELAQGFHHNRLQTFDFVFLDADKENSMNYFDIVLPMVRLGGLVAADNILRPQSCIPEMQRYSKYVQNRHGVCSVTVPIGNGEEISFKVR